MSRSAGVALASSVVLGVVAVFVFDAAWEGDVDIGWGFGARDRPMIHGLGIGLGLAWLGVYAWALVALARLLRPVSPVIAVLGIVLTGIGAVAGSGVAAFQVYLLAVLGPASDAQGEAFIDVLLHLLDLRMTYLWFGTVAGLALLAALSALAYGAARTGRGSRTAAWAVAVLPVPSIFIDWISWAYLIVVLLFAVSLMRLTFPWRGIRSRRARSSP